MGIRTDLKNAELVRVMAMCTSQINAVSREELSEEDKQEFDKFREKSSDPQAALALYRTAFDWMKIECQKKIEKLAAEKLKGAIDRLPGSSSLSLKISFDYRVNITEVTKQFNENKTIEGQEDFFSKRMFLIWMMSHKSYRKLKTRLNYK